MALRGVATLTANVAQLRIPQSQNVHQVLNVLGVRTLGARFSLSGGTGYDWYSGRKLVVRASCPFGCEFSLEASQLVSLSTTGCGFVDVSNADGTYRYSGNDKPYELTTDDPIFGSLNDIPFGDNVLDPPSFGAQVGDPIFDRSENAPCAIDTSTKTVGTVNVTFDPSLLKKSAASSGTTNHNNRKGR